MGDGAQPPNPQSPIPNPQSPKNIFLIIFLFILKNDINNKYN
jgi:hypothetical protein